MAQSKELTRAQALVAPTAKDREKIIKGILDTHAKQFGKGSLMTLRGRYATTIQAAGVIPTGSIGLDHILGIGGLPQGRIAEIYGPEAGGKTTLALHCIANAQAQGKVAAFIDAEHALHPEYAEALGVNLEELLLSQPDSGEQALEQVDALVRSSHVGVIVVDSVAALVPLKEVEGEMGDVQPGAQARLMSQAMRKLTPLIGASKCCVIFINQTRFKIGVTYGSPETTSGGNALKFYASVRLKVQRVAQLKEGEDKTGNRTKVTVVKNKLSPPFRTVEFDLVYGKGIQWQGEVLDLGVAKGLITKSGSWYSVGESRIGQGRRNAFRWMEQNPEETAGLRAKVIEALAS